MGKRFTFGYSGIRRGNAVRHIALRAESKAYCGCWLESFYEGAGAPDDLDNVCQRCLSRMPRQKFDSGKKRRE